MDKKTLGWIVLILAICMLDCFPGPTDIIGLKLYSMYSGVDVNMDNLSSIYLDYFIWSTVVGILLLILAMNLLGLSAKNLLKKIDPGKFKLALIIGGFVVVLIAILDIQGLIFFTDLGRDYTTGDFPHSYWLAFRNTAYILMGLVSLCYFAFVRQDKSEALAVFLTPFILFWAGAQDLLYFILRKVPIPSRLEWLDNHIFIGWVSSTLGFEGVTNVSLIISIFIGFLGVILTTKLLKDKF